MNLSSEHLLESMLIIIIFYLVYMLFFQNQASIKLNRFLLLTGIISGFLIPFINFSSPVVGPLDFYFQLKTVDILRSGNQVPDTSIISLSVSKLIAYCYFSGIMVFAIKFLFQLCQIFWLLLNSKFKRQQQFWLVHTGKNHPVFSFMTFVFVGSDSENSSELDIILDHERIHVVQMHSFDLLLLELLAIAQWFNPFVWLYRNQVKLNHEFLADRGVIKKGIPDRTYQKLLLGNYKSLSLGFTSSFNHSLTFKRLIMMKKSSSIKKTIIRIFILAPVLLTAVYFISCSKSEYLLAEKPIALNVEEKNSPDEGSNSNKSVDNHDLQEKKDLKFIQEGDPVYESYAIDQRPHFPGGEEALIKFVAENTNYPEEAYKKGIEGTVYVKFVVTKTGELAETTVMREVDPILEAEALRVVNSIPAWEPGIYKGEPVNVYFIIPVKFKLQ